MAFTRRSFWGAKSPVLCQPGTVYSSGGNNFIGVTIGSANPTEANKQTAWPVKGIFRGLRALTRDSQANGSLTITLRINGADTPLTVTIPNAGGAATYSDLIHAAAGKEGDLVCYNAVQSSSTSATVNAIAMEFVSI